MQNPNYEFVEQGRIYRSERTVDPFIDSRNTVRTDGKFESFEHYASSEVQRDCYSTQQLDRNMYANTGTWLTVVVPCAPHVRYRRHAMTACIQNDLRILTPEQFQ